MYFHLSEIWQMMLFILCSDFKF